MPLLTDRIKSARHAWLNPYALTNAIKRLAESERQCHDLDQRNIDLLDEIRGGREMVRESTEAVTAYEKNLRMTGEAIPEEFRRPGMSHAGQISLIVDALTDIRARYEAAAEEKSNIEWGYPEQTSPVPSPVPEDFRKDYFCGTGVKPKKAKKPVKKVVKKPAKKKARPTKR